MSSEVSSLPTMKKLPMIVDIAIDTNGKTMYQVHETSKLVRREMPKSANFSEASLDRFELYNGGSSLGDQSLGSILPSLEAIKFQTPFPMSNPTSTQLAESDSLSDNSKDNIGASSTPMTSSSCPPGDDNIWGKDVQDAFEEVLAIVPKNGLNKIKIGGRSCGRNELISDYILAKTGKFRSRKQVSSHIQVIKNMGVKAGLIKLISDGPTFNSTEESERNSHLFEEIFTKINLNKSLGVNSIYTSAAKSGGPIRRHSSSNVPSDTRARKPSNSFIGVRDIYFSLDTINTSSPAHLSVHDSNPIKKLAIKENAAIPNRFPGLEDFANLPIPIFHNMVRIFNPFLISNKYSIDSGLKTNYMLEMSPPNSILSSFTTVYSFGNEVLRVNDDDFEANTSQPFLLKFWKCFFLQLLQQPNSLDAAFKGVTVKQVIYDNARSTMPAIPKQNVKAVLLWEFSRVDDIKQAVSSTSRIILPPTFGSPTAAYHGNDYGSFPPNYQVYDSSHPAQQTQDFAHNYPVGPNSLELEMSINDQSYGGSRQFPFNAPYASCVNPVHHPSANVDLTAVRNNRVEDAPYAGQFY